MFPLCKFFPFALAVTITCMAASLPAQAQTKVKSFRATIKPIPAPPPEKWLHVKSEHFDMLSCSTKQESKDLLIHLEQFRAAFFGLFNFGRAHEEKLTIVLFDNARQYHTYHPHQGCSGFFTRSALENFMVLSTENPEGAYRTIIHEYVHSIVSDYIKGISLCFNEGLTTFFDASYISGDIVRFGDVNTGRLRALRRASKPIPLDSLLGTTHGSPNYREPELRPAFYMQSWLLMHYLLAGRHAGPKAAGIDKFTILSKDKKLPIAQAFEDSFGVGMDEVEKNLKQYLRGGTFGTRTVTVPRKPIAAKITIKPADRLDVEYVLDVLYNGICKCLLRNLDASNAQTAPQHVERASPEQWAEKTLAANPDHVAPYHRLAAIGIQKRNVRQAIEHLQQAVDRNSDNAKVYLTLAALRVPRSLGSATSGKYLPAEMSADLKALLDKAIALDPDYIEAYEAQLVVESYSEKMSSAVIKNAVATISPRLTQYPVAMAALAHIAWRTKDHAASRRIVDTLLPTLPPPAPTAKRSTSTDARQMKFGPAPRTAAPARRSLPSDFSQINYAGIVRQLDKLLAAAGHDTKPMDQQADSSEYSD